MIEMTDQGRIEQLEQEVESLKRTIEALERHQVRGSTMLPAIQQSSPSIATSLNLPAVLGTILEGMLSLLDGARAAHIYCYQNDYLAFAAAADETGPIDHPVWKATPDGLAYSVARLGETIVITDIKSDPTLARIHPGWQRAVIGLPLKIQNRIVGVMEVGYAESRNFSEAEVRLMRLLGDQAALAIEYVALFEEAQHRAALLEAVRRSALSITSTLDLHTVLQAILEGVTNILDNLITAQIYLYDGSELTFGVGIENGEAQDQPMWPPRPQGTTYFVARSGETAVIPDIRKHPLYHDTATDSYASLISQPLKMGGRVVGVMNLCTQHSYVPKESDLHWLALLGDQAAIAIENARLYNQIVSAAEALEIRVAERTAELRAYSHTIAHDLRGPLQLMMGYAEFARDQFSADLSEEGQLYLSRIVESGAHMSEMISQLLQLAELENASASAEPVEMKPRVEAAVERFRDKIESQAVQVEIASDLPSAMGHGIWIEEVFANLIGNAIKYAKPDGPLHIRITAEHRGEMVCYSVQDNGMGIRPEDQAKLFKMFSRIHLTHEKSFGLGLSIVYRIVANLNGQVGVMSDGKNGSTFWFTLPAAQEATQNSVQDTNSVNTSIT